MKINYEFVNGETKEIEVDERIHNEIKEIDRQTYNSNQRETRRHRSLDILMLYDLEPVDETADIEFQFFSKLEIQDKHKQLHKLRRAIATLNTDQKDLVNRVFFNGEQLKDIAVKYGIKYQSLQDRLKVILKKLKKLLEN